jgi:hypothetical protein
MGSFSLSTITGAKERQNGSSGFEFFWSSRKNNLTAESWRTHSCGAAWRLDSCRRLGALPPCDGMSAGAARTTASARVRAPHRQTAKWVIGPTVHGDISCLDRTAGPIGKLVHLRRLIVAGKGFSDSSGNGGQKGVGVDRFRCHPSEKQLLTQ